MCCQRIIKIEEQPLDMLFILYYRSFFMFKPTYVFDKVGEITPDFLAHDLLKRLSAVSKVSFFPTRISAKIIPSLCHL